MKARKFGYDVAYARLSVHTSSCKPILNVSLFWRESERQPTSCEAETTKESIKTKTESGKFFCIRVVLRIKLRLNCHVHKFGIQRKRKTEKKSHIEGEKTKETFFVGVNNMKIRGGGVKMRNASGH